jgi:hypothetical protein
VSSPRIDFDALKKAHPVFEWVGIWGRAINAHVLDVAVLIDDPRVRGRLEVLHQREVDFWFRVKRGRVDSHQSSQQDNSVPGEA